MFAPKRHNFSQLAVHVTFATTRRTRWIDESVEAQLWAELRRILIEMGCPVLAIGGVDDHIHMLFILPPSMAVAAVIQRVKGASSRWFQRERPGSGFSWQRGYGAFSVSRHDIPGVTRYIRNQREHHMRFDYSAEIERLASED